MNKEKTALFIGYSSIFINIDDLIKKEIIKLIHKGIDTFLNGGMGGFDLMCARCINQLKEEYPHIKHYLVIPYLSFNRCEREMFDDTIYPELEKYHYKFAIPKRNQWMIENSSYALCYIDHDWGGAIKTYRMAVKKKLNVINIAEL